MSETSEMSETSGMGDIADLSALKGMTIAFDLDGTLVDTAPDLIGALNLVLLDRGLPPVPMAATRHLVGGGVKALIQRGFTLADTPLQPDLLDALTGQFIDYYLGRIADESTVFPGVVGALETLAGAGATLCVCTNKRTRLSLALLDALDLTRHFKVVFGADLAPAAKPDPRCYLAAITAAGGDPARSLMVGDSDNDVLSAHGAGAPVVVVPFGYSLHPVAELGGDALIDHFDQLPPVAARLLAARARSAA
jgi:phosphoglycolate phosphatase